MLDVNDNIDLLECLKAACFTFSIWAGNREGFRIRRPDLIPISLPASLYNLERVTSTM